ncbi:MAG: hypothetical protein HUJ90_01565 [Bacteroidales bacterium]|nr:hypothetical protein [Bacteroidales bacterium]
MNEIYHISSEGHNVIFRSEDDFIFFMNKLGIAAEAMGVRIFAFCIMSTHIHAVIQTGDVQRYTHTLNRIYARHLNANYGTSGHQMNFTHTKLIGVEHIIDAMEYVLRNPVHHNVASNAFEYPYSSIRVAYPEIFNPPKRYWNENSCIERSIKSSQEISSREKKIIYGKSNPNKEWLIKDGKLILPECYVDVTMAKNIYRTFRSYLYGMTHSKVSSTSESNLAAYKVNDMKVCRIIDDTLAKYGCRLCKIPPEVEEELRQSLLEYQANKEQIERCLWKL